MSDGASFNINLNKTEQVELTKKDKNSDGNLELVQVGMFNSDSDIESDNSVEKISEEYSKYKTDAEESNSVKDFVEKIKEKYRAYKVERKKEKVENLKQNILKNEETIKLKEEEKEDIEDRISDKLIRKQENIDDVYNDFYNQLKTADEDLAQRLNKVKKLIDNKNINLEDVDSDLQSKMSDIQTEVVQKYSYLQEYIDKYNGVVSDYAELQEDLLDDCKSDIEKAQKKIDRANTRLDKIAPDKNKNVGSSSTESEEDKTASLKISDVQISEKTFSEQNVQNAKNQMKTILTSVEDIANDKNEDVSSLRSKLNKSYKNLYEKLRAQNPDLASELYAVKYKTEIKENQLEKIDMQIMQLQETLYEEQSKDIVGNNTLSFYEEMLSNLNKFDVNNLSENKKIELNKKKEEVQKEIEKLKNENNNTESNEVQNLKSQISELKKQRKEIQTELKTVNSDINNLQTKISEKCPDLLSQAENFVSLNLKYSSTKAEKIDELKSKYVEVLNNKNTAQIDLENIKAVENVRKYEFFDTELPENFAKNLDSDLGIGFCSKVSDICNKYGLSEKDLIGLMYSESRLKPNIKNSIGAVGLIQIIPSTARNVLNTTTEHLASLNAVDQLDYVDKYLSTCLKVGGNYDAGELYTAVYMPARVGKEVVASPSIGGYYGNTGLDTNKDGQTTKTELAQKVKNKYAEALRAYGC